MEFDELEEVYDAEGVTEYLGKRQRKHLSYMFPNAAADGWYEVEEATDNWLKD